MFPHNVLNVLNVLITIRRKVRARGDAAFLGNYTGALLQGLPKVLHGLEPRGV